MTNVLPLQRPKKPPEQNEDEQARAKRLAAKYRDASASDIIKMAVHEEFIDRIAMVSSFGAESAVLLKLVADIEPNIPVVFLETGKHFAQTLSYRNNLATALGLTNIVNVTPKEQEIEAEDPRGDLWRSDTDACCSLRKVRPLDHALEGFDAWFTGRKQFHGGARLRLPVVEWSGQHFKVNPIADWDREKVTQFAADHDLPAHPLVAQGFPSIGCWPCTHPVAEGDDVRAGRWRGQAKTECGIHSRS